MCVFAFATRWTKSSLCKATHKEINDVISECKFSVAHYLDTINAYQDSGYHIGPVSDYFHEKIYDKQILLRHDVDLSLDYALDMALLEHDNDIHATYYILLTSNLYNANSPEGVDKIRQIRRAGHEIGLHVDTRYFMGPIEFTVLSMIAQQTVIQWCQHLITITPSPHPELEGSGYGHAQLPIRKGYKYLSDSAMNWREKCWCNHINKYDKMQILIHPEWTMCSPKGLLDKWEIMNQLEWEANRRNAMSFREFKDLVKSYEQVITN